MRYIDSGTRSADQALGFWLREIGQHADEVVALRAQSGFFGADSLAILAPVIERLTDLQAPIRILIGSNDGGTRATDVFSLIEALGPSRDSLDIGVVSYAQGFFHPKTVHFTRADASMAAYVGSANLTRSGVTALHVEAGLVLDSRDGDSEEILREIGAAVDFWFDERPAGLYFPRGYEDIMDLIDKRVLGVPRPPSTKVEVEPVPSDEAGGLASLNPLFPIPKSHGAPSEVSDEPNDDDEPGDSREIVTVIESYQKRLTASDAQRKVSGNQRGSITLVRGRYTFDAQSYFREEFFSSAVWVTEVTRTGETRERAVIPMYISIDGASIGLNEIEVTHASNREAGQNNYTSLVHLGVMAPYFAATNLTGRDFAIDRQSDGTFSLTIA